MRFRPVTALLATGFVAFALTACQIRAPDDLVRHKRPPAAPDPELFRVKPPLSEKFQRELEFLNSTRQLSSEELTHIENAVKGSSKRYQVPYTLLWCLLFQESRFDVFRNASQTNGARGIGQFTRAALKELNLDADKFVPGTRALLKKTIHPYVMPLSFTIVPKPDPKLEERKGRKTESQPHSSYFHVDTAIGASAAYLGNRYHQLKRTLDRKGWKYDPEVLWMFASAAYNKGSRTVYVLLTQQREFGGDQAVNELLTNPHFAFSALTRKELLELSLTTLWDDPERRSRYITELIANMKAIHSCAIVGARL